jgi:hypothetical protein
MPCSGGGDDRYNSYDSYARADIDHLTRMLCALMTQLENNGKLGFIKDQELKAWWEDHKTRDQRRKETKTKKDDLGQHIYDRMTRK